MVRPLLRFVGAVGLVMFIGIAFTPLPSLVDRALDVGERLQPAGAIVVLGGNGVRSDDDLADVSLRRTLRGIQLYQRGLAPFIVFSGPRVARGPAEAEVRAALARRLGVPDPAILTESSALTTQQEAVRIGALLAPRGTRRILLVVDRQGMRRAAGVFHRAGFEVLPAPADDVSGFRGGPEDQLALARRLLIELAALTYYHVAGYL
jgi:uncharacterized SAM-binding protein YcdF (DUF218 family)